MADTLSDRLRSLLASDVYSNKGRLRADDLLVRERVGRGLGKGGTRHAPQPSAAAPLRGAGSPQRCSGHGTGRLSAPCPT
jgi:hypothetical protein